MFSIIISEKGGAERKESFDKNEINVGRVQGNDLMLPKGNVSKHHARLLFRDGRFIVTDLKSTNGTYVNGRKIAQATIVREGDKIYIGDFVLRLETNGLGAPPEAPTASGEEESIRTIARDNARPNPIPNPPAVTLKAPTHPPGAPLPRPMAQNVSNVPSPGQQALQQPPPPPPPPQPRDHGSQPGNFENSEMDDSAPLQRPRNPSNPPPHPPPPLQAPPGMQVGGPRPMTMPLNQMSPPIIGQRVATAPPGGLLQPPGPPGLAPPPPPPPPQPQPPPQPIPIAMPPIPAPQRAPEPAAPPPPPPQRAPEPLAPPPPPPPMPVEPPPPPAPAPRGGQSVAPPPQRISSPPRQPPKEHPPQAARKLALTMLMGRIADAVDLSPLRATPNVSDVLSQQVERAARDQADAMREEGEAPQDVDLDALVRDAHRELTGLGAFGPLLEDEDVLEIHCVRFDQIYTVRSGGVATEGVVFSSEEALHRVVARLALQSGEGWKPGELVVERRLPRASFVAVAPPASASHVVSIRKRRRVESTLDELQRSGALSRPMAQFLEACVTARANVIVSGAAPLPVVAALAAVGTGGERLCFVQDVEEIATGHANAVMLAIADTRRLGEECVRAAAKLRPDRLVVTQMTGGVAAATVDAMAEGVDGVIGAMPAPSLRQALSRLVSQLVLHRPGLSLDAMREVVGEAFDIAVEVTQLPDGRVRVARVTELAGSDAKGIVARDVFIFSTDAQSGEGSFGATGVVPRIANDLATRGLKLDGAMFKRGGR